MKTWHRFMLVVFLICILFSCKDEFVSENTSIKPRKSDTTPKSDTISEHTNPMPNEPCESISWFKTPVITQGYHDGEYLKVKVETFVKKSDFKILINTFHLENSGDIYDQQRKSKSFNLPEEINSDLDLKITIGEHIYFISDVKTGWTPRYGDRFLGYKCEIQNFEINQVRSGGNIVLRNPNYNFP